MSNKKPRLSLCMIVKNEQEPLPKCLDAVKDFVDEIIIVDTGSTDKTVEIAKKYTPNVFRFKWKNDFSAARNESLQHATGEWILVLDPDEVVSPGDLKRIRDLLLFEDTDGYVLVQRSYRQPNLLYVSPATDPNDPWARGLPCYDDHKTIRLFRRKKEIYFSDPIHETVDLSLKKRRYSIQPTNIIIHHYNPSLIRPEAKEQKDDFYLKIGLDEIQKNPKVDKPYVEVGVYYFNHADYEEALKYLTKAHELNPSSALIHFYMGLTHEMLGNTDPAVKHYEQSLAGPHAPTLPYVHLAHLYVKLGRFLDAAHLCRKGLEKNPSNFSLYNTLGYILLNHRHYRAAEALLKQGILHSPNFTNPYTIKMINNLSTVYILQEKYVKATSLLLNHLRQNPSVYEYYYNLVQLYNTQKTYTKSLALLEKGIQTVPPPLREELQKLHDHTQQQEKQEKKKA